MNHTRPARCRALVLGAALTTVLALLAARADAQGLDRQQWMTDGNVTSIAESNGIVYVCGGFSHVWPRTGGGAALDATTGSVQALIPFVAGQVWTVIADGSGGWYIGGIFTSVGGEPRNNLAHVEASGSVDNWNPSPNGWVFTLARQGDQLFVGGSFDALGGVTRAGLAAISTRTGQVTSWDPQLVGRFEGDVITVTALGVNGPTLYASGSFLGAGSELRTMAAAFDVGSGALKPWNPGINLNGAVWQFAFSGSTVIVAGGFSEIGGATRFVLAALDGETGMATPWDPNPDNGVATLLVRGSSVFVGGDFGTIGSGAGRLLRSRLAELSLVDGSALPWNPGANNTVNALASNGSQIFAAGAFTKIGGNVARSYLAALDPVTGAATDWVCEANDKVFALATQANVLYAGGKFSGIDVQARTRLAAFDAHSGIPTAWDPQPDATVSAMVVKDSTVYVGGYFRHIAGQPRGFLAAVSGTTGAALPWQPAPNAAVTALSLADSVLYVAGNFTAFPQAKLRKFLASFSTATGALTSWHPQPNAAPFAMAARGSVVYVGGHFSSFVTAAGATVARARLAALDVVSGDPTAWAPDPDGDVHALVLDGSKLYVGGAFQHIEGGLARGDLAAYDLGGGGITNWNPSTNGTVFAIEPVGSLVYIGGSFTRVGSTLQSFLASVDMSTGALTAFAPALSSSVRTLLDDGTRIYVGGDFDNSVDGHRYLCSFFEPQLLSAPETPRTPGVALELGAGFPNPARRQSMLRLSLPHESVVTMRVFDVQGRVVLTPVENMRLAAGTHDLEVRVEGLPTGAYWCRVSDGTHSATRPILVCR
jgi:trimeric autotransporter adhesin